MRSSWQQVIDSVLRPARPGLARCLAERDTYVASAEHRARALRDCERRIELARAAVFAANDGVIPATMTALEREWRTLSRRDLDGELMGLWARIAPSRWIDNKRWRDTDRALQLDAAVALSADVEGVETAESAVRDLGRVRFRMFEQDSEHCSALLAEPLSTAIDAIARRGDPSVLIERARRFEREIYEAALARFPSRPLLAADLAHAAFVDRLWSAAALAQPSPVLPLLTLWCTGYVLASVDASGVTLEIPRL